MNGNWLVNKNVVLNALRHHRGRHTSCLGAFETDERSCSTPCGITEVGTVLSQTSCERKSRVLNALRHHRGRHPRIHPATSLMRTRAQRLAASQRSAPDPRRDGVSRRVCSTPCGITEVGTRPQPGMANLGAACAQRLAASQRSAPSSRSLPRWDGLVLNALRHHRGRHECLRSHNQGCGQVLNALRHHRGRHPDIPEPSGPFYSKCSTPCGITEVGTLTAQSRPPRVRQRAQRLAASQRSARRSSRHEASTSECAQRLAASQRSAREATHRCRSAFDSAQRLAASQRSAPLRRQRARDGEHRVLNALRHHRGRHTDPDLVLEQLTKVLNALRHHRGRHPENACVVGPESGAQRLAASQRSARE